MIEAGGSQVALRPWRPGSLVADSAEFKAPSYLTSTQMAGPRCSRDTKGILPGWCFPRAIQNPALPPEAVLTRNSTMTQESAYAVFATL